MDPPANGHGFPSASIDRWSMRLSGCGGLAVLGLLLMAAAPRTLGWSVAPSMGTARYAHTSTLVTNDCVLVVGGQANSGALSSCELYNPNTNGWTPSGSLAVARAYHTATFLGNGKVLIVGGL